MSFYGCGKSTSESASSIESAPSFSTETVHINTATQTLSFTVEVADTNEKRSYGLMNRTSLETNHGMIFIFDSEDTHSFWMKDTYIALDMIFVDAQKHVIYIEENTTPLSETPITPTSPSQYVLEVPAGTANTNDINIGDTLVF